MQNRENTQSQRFRTPYGCVAGAHCALGMAGHWVWAQPAWDSIRAFICNAAAIPSSEEANFSLCGVLVPVGGWAHTLGRAGDNVGTPDGLEPQLGAMAALPALRRALESSCCQPGGGTARDLCSGPARSLISHSHCPRCPNTPPTSSERMWCPLLWETSLEVNEESRNHQVWPFPPLANPLSLMQPAAQKHKAAGI